MRWLLALALLAGCKRSPRRGDQPPPAARAAADAGAVVRLDLPAPQPEPRPALPPPPRRTNIPVVKVKPTTILPAPVKRVEPPPDIDIDIDVADDPGGVVGDSDMAPPPEPPAPPPPPPATVGGGPVDVIDLDQRAVAEPGNPTPEYPADARTQQLEGLVIVRIDIAADGSVTKAQVLKGEPPFTDAVLSAVKRWRFQPARAGGQPVATRQIFRFPFRL